VADTSYGVRPAHHIFICHANGERWVEFVVEANAAFTLKEPDQPRQVSGSYWFNQPQLLIV
jgi:hypothetical protein